VLKEKEAVTRWFPNFTYKFSYFFRQDPPSSIAIPYEAWYYIPPRYRRFRTHVMSTTAHRVGFGFRYDKDLNARVMDINFDSDTASGYRFFTLVEGD